MLTHMFIQTGNYYLERECIIPPEELQRQIFPLIEQTKAMNDARPEGSRDIATHCFMTLLTWFRIVVLQDAVYLWKKHPSLKIWLNPVFISPLFESFSKQLLHEAEHGEAP